jgi:Short C-terminal domain
VAESPAEPDPAEPKPSPRPPRRALVTVLIVVGSLLGFLTINALWLNRQALNTDNWASSSSQLLESPAIRTAVAGYLVDQAYANFDVTGELRKALPTQAKPLAGPAAGGLRNLAQQGIEQLLQRPAVQTLWEQANRVAHARLMQVINGGHGPVSTSNGTVSLDLGLLLQQTANGIGLGQSLAQKLPPGTAEITLVKSKQLKTVQQGAKALRTLPFVLLVLTLLLYGIAILVAGRRREALRSVGVGFVAAGIVALLARSLGGNAAVDAFATTAAARPAAHDIWRIETSQLVLAAQAAIFYGVVIFLAAWLAGPTRVAVSARTWGAPYLHDARYAYGALGVLLVILIAWGPTPATRNAITLLFMIALLALGLELLRRQTAREHPAATPALAAERNRAWADRAWTSVSDGFGRLRERGAAAAAGVGARAGSGDGGGSADGPVATLAPEQVQALTRLEALERLGRLRDSGVLDDDEFKAEKQRLLG